MLSYAKSLEVVDEPDVLVCGAGCAGIGAAVAAARSGARTLVVDRMGFAGGFFTAIMGSAFDGLTDQRTGHPVVGGVVFDMIETMGVVKRVTKDLQFTATGEMRDIQNHPTWLVAKCDPEAYKRAADTVLTSSGARILYHTQVADVVTRGRRIDAVVLSNKRGLVAVRPKTVVDCTGDGDVAAWSGATCEIGEPLQPMSLHFRVFNVDPTQALAQKYRDVTAEAYRKGEIGVYGGPWVHNWAPNDSYYNVVRIAGNPTDPDDLTRVEIQGRKDAWRLFELWKARIPEYSQAYFAASGPTAGARESRRLVGTYVLTVDDVLERRRHPDVVVLGAWRLDRHPADQAGYHQEPVVAPYEIPFRTLLPVEIENLLVAGRCHSATAEALSSTRVTATSMGMGQAAGTAAAMCAAARISPHEVNVPRLQTRLIEQRAILESD